MKQASEPRTLASHPEPQGQSSFFFFQLPGQPKKNVLERVLSVFADVRAGEGATTILLAINVFLLLAGYSLMKPARPRTAYLRIEPGASSRKSHGQSNSSPNMRR